MERSLQNESCRSQVLSTAEIAEHDEKIFTDFR
jgi:hypothetical protein